MRTYVTYVNINEYSKLLVEIGTPEVDIYMKDFSFFVIFSKTAQTIFFLNSFFISMSSLSSGCATELIFRHIRIIYLLETIIWLLAF